jgi:hypothetical protein
MSEIINSHFNQMEIWDSICTPKLKQFWTARGELARAGEERMKRDREYQCLARISTNV